MTHIRLVASAVAALFLAAPFLHAQGNSEAARLRRLNTDLLRLHGQVRQGSPSEQAQARSQAGAVLEQRAGALNTLIAQSPAEALSLAFPSELLTELADSFPESARLLESRGRFEGPIEYLVEDQINSSRSIRRMQLGGQQLEVYFAGPEPAGLKSRNVL